MEDNAKVFFSNITNVGYIPKNNLYELLNIIPATPIKLNDTKTNNFDFTPKTGKYYIPKKKTKTIKVKTVRDIRKSFEQDVFTHLTTDLEKQESILFKKIRRGSSKDDNTKSLATKILRGDNPISRSTWQMLINLNPENKKYPRQFVLWNGQYIQVNGSFGGINKNICNFDLASKPQYVPLQNHNVNNFKQHEGNRKKRLLRNSLAVKFKPGPLSKKPFLDKSHQRHNVGNIELINLPKPGLDVQPKYGTALESSISHFLNSLRTEDGTITQKWAELSVSVVGRVEKSKAVQLNRDSVTFDLSYKYNQNRLLMRRDVEHCMNSSEVIASDIFFKNPPTEEIKVEFEIKDMVNKIIDAVEINLIQDKLFTQDQELQTFPCKDLNSENTVTYIKDKLKRKFGELDRLDVTVITLPGTEEGKVTRSCSKMHCSFGCICPSIQGTYKLKQHCGRVECMFDCKCEFSNKKNDLSYIECTDVLPGLLSMDDEMNLNLAKEEQKFHQTVIVTGEKRILLKRERRNWKTSKKYADFYSNMSLKHENHKTQNVSVIAIKLNCDNIEPWCMVHKLYKCFCKGKFTYTCMSDSNDSVGKEPLSKDNITNVDCLENSRVTYNNDVDSSMEEHSYSDSERQARMSTLKRMKRSDNSDTRPNKIHKSRSMNITASTSKIIENPNYSDPEDEIKINRILLKDYLDFWNDRSSSSRTKAYEGRKYTDGYYRNVNNKISTMEKNDKRLQERLTFLYSRSCGENIVIKPTRNTKSETARLLQLLFETDTNGAKRKDSSTNTTNLASWLESHFKAHRQRKDTGIFKNTLEPPKNGKVALHCWDFILRRYRERKNLFLVSGQAPYRIFMAVNTANPYFENCIDINDIRFADLHKYPQTIKNLLINATDLKDNFCILRGLPFCWELIGTVSKINENDKHSELDNTTEMKLESSDMETSSDSVIRKPVDEKSEEKDILDIFGQSNSEVNNLVYENTEHSETLSVLNHNLEIRNSLVEIMEQKDFQDEKGSNQNNSEVEKPLLENMEHENLESVTEKEFESNTTSDDTGSSKWFVMTVENDFSEIRFFRKGFFVKYGSIVTAISVACLSGKTVRLSSKKCGEKPEDPQFGIYAIPNDKEHTVFVGPYEMEDTLGIETIKTVLEVRRLKRTRGFWITTNKIDNLKVVENPLSFVPQPDSINNECIPLETHFYANDELDKTEVQERLHINKTEESKECSPSKKGQIKIVKPIRIRKTNGFYHLASDGILKNFSLHYPQNSTKKMPIVLKKRLNMEDNGVKSLTKPVAVSNNLNDTPIPETSQEPNAEASSSAASQIQISAVFSTQNDYNPIAKRPCHERGMFILKPEEINRKLVQNKLTEETLTSTDEHNNINDGTTNLDLLSSGITGLENVTTEQRYSADTESGTLNDDIYVISDDENCNTSGMNADNIWADVWIECTNIPNLGWIAGIKNWDNLISFKIPGCEYSEFFPEKEAFTKINM